MLFRNIRINSTLCFIMKIPNKREFQQISFNYSSETAKPFSLLVNDTTLASDNVLIFTKNLSERI